MKKILWLPVALFVLSICPSAYAIPTRNGPPLTCEGNTSGCKITLPVAAVSDIVWCGINPIYGSSASCSCPGGIPHTMDSQSFASPAATAFVLQMFLTGCAAGSDVITVTSSGSTIEATVVDITGSPAIDVFAMGLPASVNASSAALTASVTTTSADYCLSWATDAAGNGGSPQIPAAPFAAQGSPKDAYPENFADFTQTAAGSIQASWQYVGATTAAVMSIACFKTAPILTSVRICNSLNLTQCMDFPAGANTFSVTLYIVTNGTQSPALGVDSFTILPTP